jgi:hypothetical protein
VGGYITQVATGEIGTSSSIFRRARQALSTLMRRLWMSHHQSLLGIGEASLITWCTPSLLGGGEGVIWVGILSGNNVGTHALGICIVGP